MATQNPTEQGQTKRVSTNEATAVIGGVPLIDFASFSFDMEDPSPRETSVDGNRIHFDQLLEPSGSASVYPTSTSAPELEELIRNRTLMTVRYSYPSDDEQGARSVIGCRITNFSHGDVSTDSYTIDVDWEGDFLS